MTRDLLPILSCGGVDLSCDDPETLRDLKPLLAATMTKPPRRISRFIQLAMIAATRCVGDRELPPETDICLTSGSGDFDVTFDVLNRVFREKQAPKPLSFINTVSNAACFYLTKLFFLHGASTFVSRRCFAMESALSQALHEARAFNKSSFLVGGVDILTVPLNIHAERLGVPDDTALAEGSHWFLLGEQGVQAPLGWLEDVRYFHDVEEASAWLRSLPESQKPDYMAHGFWLSSVDFRTLKSATSATDYETYCQPSGFYETAVGLTIADYLVRPRFSASRFMHAQADDDGQVCLVSIIRD